MSEKNEATYSAANIINYYAQLELLQPAEQTILDQLRHQLPTIKMLDIGIGGGRTTKHFAPLVESYTGIDYSHGMIEACQKRFQNQSDVMTLQVGDARNMAEFADNSFDFILFSFNGIDYVSHGDRLDILQEINRIGKTGCYVLFSSHNLQAMAKEFDWKNKLSFNPIHTYVNLIMLVILILFNLSITYQQLTIANHLIIKDESHNFKLKTYYIRAEAQTKQLEKNFSNIEIYSWKTGLKISNPAELSAHPDLWLYYFCQVTENHF
ncbi:class I SAM-dependent methyltransferase [[Limnothrix rosea] IAM M-220]|uniref:class I SAM-dependent methyltransferase n=1 Tax=[Limnothrix rosea] IAM M-220 TaxID=454133 RepID=UPI00096295E1|nr:class I SAM-dependent methyltransferase [[Limnothrix rosea] IAM M-220]OKH17431.1 SAM-dependent methyltransferase [[Limnothrix rosea] IAM M-220]